MTVTPPPSDDPIAALMAAACAPIPDPPTRLPLDRKETETFLHFIGGPRWAEIEFDFAVFTDDKKWKAHGIEKPPTWRRRGTLATMWRSLVKANAAGSGVFLTINESDGQGFDDKNITRVRAVFVDDDREDAITYETIAAAGAAPSASIISGGGSHHYLRVWGTEGDTLEKFSQVQRALAAKFGTDHLIHNRGRVMRLPGFLWQKPSDADAKDPDPNWSVDPFLVWVEHVDSTQHAYSMDEVIAALGLTLTQDDAGAAPAGKRASTALALLPKVDPTRFSGAFSKLSEGEEIAQVPVFVSRPERIRRARAYIAAMGPAIQGQGGDTKTFQAAAIVARDFDLEDEDALDVLEEWNQTCEPPWTTKDLLAKIRSARKSASKNSDGTQGPIGAKALAAERLESSPMLAKELPAWEAKPGVTKGPLVAFSPANEGEPGAIAYQDKDGATKWVMQTQPGDDQIAAQTPLLIHYLDHVVLNYPGVGQRFFTVSIDNIAASSSRENLMASLAQSTRAMMAGKYPTPHVFKVATEIVCSLPKPHTILEPIRWSGEDKLALHEIPQLVEGDWSAHEEFVKRASCRDTLMAWVWTCFLPEDQTGREALLIFGNGNDGKSVWSEVLMRFLGPAATSSEILKGENRFELANLIGKRLVYFGDFRNPRPIHSKIMREIISGAFLSFERKGKDMDATYFHPRCLLSTNVEPRILVNNRAERTRVRRINISQLEGNAGDRDWPKRLQAQMPAFLFECRKVWQRFATPGQDLPYTAACLEALKGGSDAMDEEFDSLAERLDITNNEEDVLTTKRLVEIFEAIKWHNEWQRKNAREWLRARGAKDKHETGKPMQRKINKTTTNVWVGVREKSTGLYRDIATKN